ncbi:MAG: PTS sugar transporter subunit IIA [Thermodesulfobacteriota bacterium]
MIGAIVVTHNKLADGLIDAAEAIVGKIENVTSVSINKGDSTDEIRERIHDAIKGTDQGEGIIIFTDMFGGTPTNIALSFLSEGTVEVLTGVNLPILLKFLSNKEENSIAELVRDLRECGRDSIVPASEMLKQVE